MTSFLEFFPNLPLIKSVQSHLTHLLNTRKGSLSYLPDYGLPDLHEIYQNLPGSIAQLIKALTELIQKYEPRIVNFTLIPRETQKVEQVLELEMHAKLVSTEEYRFRTQFLSNGSAMIQGH